MSQKIVITNLRIPQEMWLEVKTTAASLGLSANEYIKELIDTTGRNQFFAYHKQMPMHKPKRKSIYGSLWKLLNKPYNRKPMGASSDDKIIYGVDDE